LSEEENRHDDDDEDNDNNADMTGEREGIKRSINVCLYISLHYVTINYIQ